jgi:hypothetical protein
MSSRNTFGVQRVRNGLERVTRQTLSANARTQSRGQHHRPTENNARRATSLESVDRARADNPRFPSSRTSHDAGQELASRRRQVDPEIKRDQVPTVALSASHQRREVHETARQPIQPRHNQSPSVTTPQQRKRFGERGPTFHRGPRRASVCVELDEVPASAKCFTSDRSFLRLQSRAALNLFHSGNSDVS